MSIKERYEKSSRLTTVLISVAVLFAVLVIEIGILNHFQVDPYNPYQKIETAQVFNGDDDNATPVVKLDDDVKARITMCIKGADGVNVYAAGKWSPVDHPGLSLPGQSGVTTRPAGCSSKIVEFPLPENVKKATKRYMDAGEESVKWRLSVVEEPTDRDGAVTVQWQYEDFLVVK
jgi:hypothetical protein